MRGTVPVKKKAWGEINAVMQRAECVNLLDWSFDSRIAIEAYRSHARSHEDLPLLSNQKRRTGQGWEYV
jgi:hypothetical protein